MSSNIPKRMVIGGNKKIKDGGGNNKIKDGGGNNKIKGGGETFDIQWSLINFFVYFFILLAVAVVFDSIKNNRTGVSKKTYTYAFLGIIIPAFLILIAGGIQYVNTITNPGVSFIIKLIIITIIVLLFTAIVYFFQISTYIYILIVLLIVIIGLAIVFHQFYDTFERTIQTSSFKFVIEFIFFIPCIFNDILRWGLNQIHMTHYFTYVILLIEILLIIIYFFLPVILNRTILGSETNVKILQDEPFYINKGKQRKIANATDLQKKPSNSKDLLNNINPNEPIYNKDYAFSMWINMNPQTISSDKEIQIFTYGLIDKNLKPKIVYKTNSTPGSPSIQNVYRIYFTGNQTVDKNNYYDVYLPNQKWNHFVLNYIEGQKVEVWINGKMERVFTFGKNENTTIPMPIYNAVDLVAIGSSKQSGTNGAICSILYFYKSITASKVVSLYNLGVTTKPYPGNYST